MSQMLDLIKRNAVPAAVIRSAARGALSIPADEMIEILVYLTNNPVVGQEAKLTLAGWDESSARTVLCSSAAPQEVLEYFWAEQNRRPSLMPALIENSKIAEQQVAELGGKASRELVNSMLASARVRSSPAILEALLRNPHLSPDEAQHIRSGLGEEPGPADHETEVAHQNWKQEHASEISAEEGKPFELTGAADEPPEPAPASLPAAVQFTAAVKPDREKVSTIQKIARMTVAARVRTAFLGNKEDRSILVRDGSKIVQNAVLASPKLSEPEVEMFAAAKNVQENVLREIARNRRFMKSYTVIRNLVTNPRCPLDVSLTLVKNLLINDLKNLQANKNVPDTVRKVASKMYKEKTTPPGQ